MTMTAQNDHNAETEYFKRVPEDIVSMPPSDVTVILTLPQRPGGEMYGM